VKLEDVPITRDNTWRDLRPRRAEALKGDWDGEFSALSHQALTNRNCLARCRLRAPLTERGPRVCWVSHLWEIPDTGHAERISGSGWRAVIGGADADLSHSKLLSHYSSLLSVSNVGGVVAWPTQ
jgi:hypothetical protein